MQRRFPASISGSSTFITIATILFLMIYSVVKLCIIIKFILAIDFPYFRGKFDNFFRHQKLFKSL